MRCHSPGGAHFLPEMHFSLVRHVLASRQLFIDGANLSHLLATLNNALPVVNGTIDVLMKLILFGAEFVVLISILFILNWKLSTLEESFLKCQLLQFRSPSFAIPSAPLRDTCSSPASRHLHQNRAPLPALTTTIRRCGFSHKAPQSHDLLGQLGVHVK